MTDWSKTVGFIEELILAMDPTSPVVDRAALYGGLCAILDNLGRDAENMKFQSAIAREKIIGIRTFSAIFLGINGTSESKYRTIALGDLKALEKVLREA